MRGQAPLNFAYIVVFEAYGKDDYCAARYREVSSAAGTSCRFLPGRYSGITRKLGSTTDIKAIDSQPFGDFLASMEASELSEAFWDAGLVRDLTRSNVSHPSFNVFLAAQAHANDRGFLSKEITVRSMLEHRGDIHHINPRNYLKKHGHTRRSYNQLANYVYMQQETNIAVGDQAAGGVSRRRKRAMRNRGAEVRRHHRTR